MDAYDEVPYPDSTVPETYPPQIAAVATLLGVEPPAPATARVLEIGCAAGGNLLPMAARLPDATFVGIDRSARQVARAQAHIAALGLANVQVSCLDLCDAPADWGSFDYIIVHGVYSWVPAAVRDALMALVGRHLSEAGIAYISYNTLPGWHLHGAIRELMLHHGRDATTPAERVAAAQEVIELLTRHQGDASDPCYRVLGLYARRLQQILTRLGDDAAAYLLHDHLEAVNDPVYVSAFMAHAASHRLHYLGDAHFPSLFPGGIPRSALDHVAELSGDAADTELFLDVLRGATFRQSLLRRAAQAPGRRITPERLMGLTISSRAVAIEADDAAPGAVRFGVSSGASFDALDAVSQAGMRLLSACWPAALPFDELFAQACRAAGLTPDAAARRSLAATLLVAASRSTSLVTLRLGATPVAAAPGTAPLVDPLVRWQASRGAEVTNRYHEVLDLDPLGQALCQSCDGRHSIAALEHLVAGWLAAGALPALEPGIGIAEAVARQLRRCALAALLVPQEDP